MSSIGTLGDKPLLGTAGNSWPMVPGVGPSMAEFALRPGDADELLSGPPRTVDLVLDAGRDRLRVQGLYVIRRVSSPNPREARVLVADRRYWWQYAHVLRRFNLRRRVGTRRLTSAGVRELDPLGPDLVYAPFSLRDGDPGSSGRVPWTANDALLNVIEELIEAEPVEGRGPSTPIFDESFESIPVENLELDDAGPEALKRVLAFLPEATVTVDIRGSLRIYSAANGSEGDIAKDAGFEIVGGGSLDDIALHRLRPSRVDVLFTREIEIRIDVEELELGSTTDRSTDGRWADNVLPVPDYELTLSTGETVHQGTWVTFTQYLNAINAEGVPGLGTLNIRALRRAAVPYYDLWSGLELNGALSPDADWASRVAALNTHFRKTYRINPRFMDRLFSIRAYRVATIDPTLGTRGRAEAYSDYAIIPSMRTRLLQAAGNQPQSFVINVVGYPTSGTIGSTTKPTPVNVRILDEDQGIFHLDWTPHVSRAYREVLPSQVEVEGNGGSPGVLVTIPGPSGDLSNRSRSIAFDGLPEGVQPPILMGNHKVIAILTGVPGAPNTDAQLERVSVSYADVADLLPPGLRGIETQAYGPPMEVRIGEGRESARVAWLDSASDRIDQALGITASAGDTVDLSDLIVNYEKGGLGTGSLKEIARAYAASVYAYFADRVEGTKATDLQSELRPTGRMTRVEHGIDPDGKVTTRMELTAPSQRINPFAFLPDSTRRKLMRIVQPGGGA